MWEVFCNHMRYYSRTMNRVTRRHGPIPTALDCRFPFFTVADDADIDATPCRPATRAKLKRCLLLRDQINHYYLNEFNEFIGGVEYPIIDPAHKELIEEVRKVLDAGPIEIR